MTDIYAIVLIIGAYLLGSVSFAVLVSRLMGLPNPHSYGSKNPGATNVLRTGNKKAAILTLLGDSLKGFVAVMLAKWILQEHAEPAWFIGGVALAVFLGHVFPIWHRFQGGKGVATLFGMILTVQPVIAASCVGVFLLVLFLTRYVSLSSILAGIALPICVLWIWNDDVTLYRVFAVLVAIMIILTHQKNIIKILRGSESRVPIFKARDRRKLSRK
jgi:glycerol-3-phosphate acyltransferase PlsY